MISFRKLRTRTVGRIAIAVSAATVATVIGFGGSASAAASWQWWNDDSDSCADRATLDANRNGYSEDQWFDLDNDCRVDTRIWNTAGGDWFLEAVKFDMNEDGRWETWAVDTNQAVGYEIAYYDNNGDGYYDFAQYITPGAQLGVIGGTPQLTATGSVYNLHLGDFWAP